MHYAVQTAAKNTEQIWKFEFSLSLLDRSSKYEQTSLWLS